MPEDERRSAPRIQPPRAIFVDYPDLRPRIRDISVAGASIEEVRPLPRGRMINLQLVLDEEKPIAVQAIVRRSQGDTMSVEFLVMNSADRELLRRFIDKARAAQRAQAKS
ncbi:MAG: PilZ domain-containing protein [Acidobacteria bacterium]|nr:PilZ domain-containing protein [Acidobacteriota bacterium]